MVEISGYDYLDQMRYIFGIVLAFFLFFYRAAPKRNQFWLRVVSGFIVCVAASFGYIVLLQLFYQDGYGFGLYSVIAILYWLAMNFVLMGYMMYCFQISLGHSLFRGLMAIALESLVTTVLKYFIVLMLLPDLPERYTVSYILLSVMVYAVIYGVFYRFIALRIQETKSVDLLNNRRTVAIYAILIILFSLIADASRGVCEWIIRPMEEYQHMESTVWIIQSYSIVVMFILSIIVLLLQFYVYETAVLQNEKNLFQRLLLERKTQYEHSKENIDIINQKCHELKHQITALEKASEEERSQLIQETKKAVMFYDSVVKTSNEVLNTILTEKSLYCVSRGINLTCMANAEHLSNIEGTDLYTILENALDNAITCAESLQEEGKKAVAISIYERGKMLYMSVENYYENPILVRGGLPASSKKGRGRYGMGIQSIRMIARKYGGDIRVTMEDQIFILQIAIPISGTDTKRVTTTRFMKK